MKMRETSRGENKEFRDNNNLFLNPERISMPDIDTDFSKHARMIAIAYVKSKYGERAVAGIMTKGKMAAKSALTYAPKLLGLEKFSDKKYFVSLGTEMRKLVGDEPNACLSNYNDKIKEAFAGNEEALTILEYANMLEGCLTSYGQHAAGLICIQNDEIENYIPLMATTDAEDNEVFVIQGDMNEAEGQLGFIKFDFLGLKNLNIITTTMQILKRNKGITIDPYNLPFEEVIFREIFAKGDTNFVFQFESDGMKGMLKQLRPTCFGDIVLAVSVYRPGPMDFIPDIIASKNGLKESEFIIRFPQLKEVYAETYGYPVYQEEVMKTFVVCAGFSTGKADIVRRHMSKKHEKELAEIRPEFIEGCKNNNISAEDANWLFDQLMPFSKYGFNKSHAAAYSLVSYITAYEKYYHKKEYLCGAMTMQGEKTGQFLADCKASNIDVYRPDVNNSEADYSVYNDGIIIGLSAIKGLKEDAAKIVEERVNHGLYKSLEDLIERAPIRSNNLEALIEAGACDTFINDRISAVEFANEYSEAYTKLKAAREKRNEVTESLLTATEETEINKLNRSLVTAKKNVENATNQLRYIPKPSKVVMSTSKRLALESKTLGMMVTGNPLEDYDISSYKKITDIDAEEVVTIAGIISESKRIITKNGQDMCICSLMDCNNDVIKVVCFPNNYDVNAPFLEEGKIICITGDIKIDESPEIIVREAYTLIANAETLVVSVSNIAEYKEVVEPILLRNVSADGVSITINNKQMQELREVSFKVSKNCLPELEANGLECA